MSKGRARPHLTVLGSYYQHSIVAGIELASMICQASTLTDILYLQSATRFKKNNYGIGVVVLAVRRVLPYPQHLNMVPQAKPEAISEPIARSNPPSVTGCGPPKINYQSVCQSIMYIFGSWRYITAGREGSCLV